MASAFLDVIGFPFPGFLIAPHPWVRLVFPEELVQPDLGWHAMCGAACGLWGGTSAGVSSSLSTPPAARKPSISPEPPGCLSTPTYWAVLGCLYLLTLTALGPLLLNSGVQEMESQ